MSEEKEQFGIKDFMEDFKEFMKAQGEDPEVYDDLAFDIVEVLSMYDSFVSQIMAARQQRMQQQMQGNPKEGGKKLFVPEKTKDGQNIVTGDFNK